MCIHTMSSCFCFCFCIILEISSLLSKNYPGSIILYIYTWQYVYMLCHPVYIHVAICTYTMPSCIYMQVTIYIYILCHPAYIQVAICIYTMSSCAYTSGNMYIYYAILYIYTGGNVYIYYVILYIYIHVAICIHTMSSCIYIYIQVAICIYTMSSCIHTGGNMYIYCVILLRYSKLFYVQLTCGSKPTNIILYPSNISATQFMHPTVKTVSPAQSNIPNRPDGMDFSHLLKIQQT